MRRIHESIGSRLCAALFFAWFGTSLWSNPSFAADAKTIVQLMNVMYGNVANASVEGWLSKTLKIDWTPRTTKLHAMKVLAEVGSVKSALYDDGIGYLKFPNDAGGYNIIDWKTGEKKSVDERAPYFFR
jgi:hypothetical protein